MFSDDSMRFKVLQEISIQFKAFLMIQEDSTVTVQAGFRNLK